MKPSAQYTSKRLGSLTMAVAFISLSVLTQCQFTTDVAEKATGFPKDGFPKKNTFIPLDNISQLSGSVRIRLEDFGSVRAKVYAMGEQQFEFILDREKTQDLLTENIEKADVHLLRLENSCFIVGIAIDDLTTGKRYVLDSSPRSYWARQKVKEIPSIAKQTILINGYAAACTQSGMRFEDPI